MKTVSMDDFDSLYRTFGPMVLRRCRFLLKDEEKALDAMQDVFVRIIERKSRLQSVCASLFYVTATRVCLNKIRADKGGIPHEERGITGNDKAEGSFTRAYEEDW